MQAIIGSTSNAKLDAINPIYRQNIHTRQTVAFKAKVYLDLGLLLERLLQEDELLQALLLYSQALTLLPTCPL